MSFRTVNGTGRSTTGIGSSVVSTMLVESTSGMTVLLHLSSLSPRVYMAASLTGVVVLEISFALQIECIGSHQEAL